ncbi:hypothetical protein P3T18_003352 [Paraburkholderia sp. GAS199]|uniref:hypothetical protein n=1 Tax=Paraburkholderia sp. GAS199 TaxID=3035126 RepID=UPI003D1E983B
MIVLVSVRYFSQARGTMQFALREATLAHHAPNRPLRLFCFGHQRAATSCNARLARQPMPFPTTCSRKYD